MPFVRRDLPSKDDTPSEGGFDSRVAELGSPDPETRWTAARALGGRPEAVPALTAALDGEPSPRVREAIMTALMRTGDEASVKALLPYLRSQDAGQRAAVIEALQALPDAILPFMDTLLENHDSDIRILAAELARNMPAADATRILCALLAKEPHPNVCAAVIEVLAEVGTRDAVPVLRACAERFATTPFLPFAVSTAIARIADAKG